MLNIEEEVSKVKIYPFAGFDPVAGSGDSSGWDIAVHAVVHRKKFQSAPNDWKRKVLFDFERLSSDCEEVFFFSEPEEKRVKIMPGEMISFGSGIVIDMPPTLVGYFKTRSGTRSDKLAVANCDTPIDHWFRGEPIIEICNTDTGDEPQFIYRGDMLAELVFELRVFGEPEIVRSYKELSRTSRGANCNHSTGRRHPTLLEEVKK